MSDEHNELQTPLGAGGEETSAPNGAADGFASESGAVATLPEKAAPDAAPVFPDVASPDGDNRFDQFESYTSHDAGQGVEMGEINYDFTFRTLKEGDVIPGRVVHIDREGALVDVGTKSEGLVSTQELWRNIPGASEEPVKVGDIIDVYVIDPEDNEGNPVLSKKRADFEKAWERVLEAKNEDRTLKAMVTDRVKGGLVVDLGIRGFIPASHVGNGRVRNLDQYVAQVLPLKVIEVDKERRKVVLSHRMAMEEEREQQRQETVTSLGEGQVRTGTVRRITDYGAFVDLGGIDGLLHISEMSWTRIKHPSEVVKVGDDIQVMVLKVNLDQNRVSLGLRQILPDPWTEVASHINIGDQLQGTVSRLVPFGAFVQLEGGIEGIIPNIELSSKRISKPEQVVKVGDEVEVRVKEIQKDERRIVLSKRDVDALKEQENVQQFNRERQQQAARERDQQRFTIGDALAEQLTELNKLQEGDEPVELRTELSTSATIEHPEDLEAQTASGGQIGLEARDLDPVIDVPEGEDAPVVPGGESVSPEGAAQADAVAAGDANAEAEATEQVVEEQAAAQSTSVAELDTESAETGLSSESAAEDDAAHQADTAQTTEDDAGAEDSAGSGV